MTDLKDSIEQFKKKVSHLKETQKNVPDAPQGTSEEGMRKPEKEIDDTLHEIVGTTKSTFEILKK